MNFYASLSTETIIALAAAVFCVCGFVSSAFGRRGQRKNRLVLESIHKQVEALEITVARNKEIFDTNIHKMAEQSRRITWLETRVRQPKLAAEEAAEELPVAETLKLTMTERRHRVTRLASHGQRVEEIANALGMLPGEVELIVNLNRASAAIGA